MNIQKHLLTWEEYNEIKFSTPHVFTIEKNNQTIVYIGAKHSFDPQEEQFKIIRDQFKKFSKRKGDKVVIIEGGDKWQVLNTEEETIKRYGEPAFTKHLAINEGITFISPEPSREEMNNFVKDKFSEEEIVYYKVAQQALHYKNMQIKPDESEFLQTKIDYDIKQFSDKYKTPEDIKKLHKKLFDTEFDLNNRNHFYEIANPAIFKSRFNELAREKDILRDTKIVQNILNYWNKGYSVFVVYGSAHAIIQERALKKLAK